MNFGEIEYKLLKCDGIKDAVVVPVENSSKLAAYYISDTEFDLVSLRKKLGSLLPNYMIPNYFMKLDALPYTPNGKVDRKALPLPYNVKLEEDNQYSSHEINYIDYSEWEFENLKNGNLDNSKEFWINQFKDDIPSLDFPIDFSRPNIQNFEGAKISKKLDIEFSNEIRNLAKTLGVSEFMLLLSVYYVLLFKYTGKEDIVVGTPILGRDKNELMNMLGMFVNTLALKNKLTPDMCFEEFVKSVKENCIKAFTHELYPFDELLKDLKVKRNISKNPIFDTMFIYQNTGSTHLSFENIKANISIPDMGISKFDITFEMIPETNGEISFNIEYCTKLFKEETIQKLSSHFINIIKCILIDSDIKIKDIEILSETEKNTILFEFNDTKKDFPTDKTIIELFKEQVSAVPRPSCCCL